MIYFNDAVYLALFYLKNVGVDLVSLEAVQAFQSVINQNLRLAGCSMLGSYVQEEPFYSVLKNEDGITYFAWREDIDLAYIKCRCVGSLPLEIVLASELPSSLAMLGLVLEDDHLKKDDHFDHKSKDRVEEALSLTLETFLEREIKNLKRLKSYEK